MKKIRNTIIMTIPDIFLKDSREIKKRKSLHVFHKAYSCSNTSSVNETQKSFVQPRKSISLKKDEKR